MEAEIRALQRNVFPGGGGKIFTPEIWGPLTRTVIAGRPATTPTADLAIRLESIERSLTSLTTRLQHTSERISQLEQAARADEPAKAAAIKSDLIASPPATTRGIVTNATVAKGSKTTPPSKQRLAAVLAIIKPRTNDAGDDEYSYGYRLWRADLYPEAQQQLKMFIEKYPQHARVSFARNLLGRSFLDDNHPMEAAKWFLANYRGGRTDPRAPDSLLYLSMAMLRLKDNKRACISLGEFRDVYSGGDFTRLKTLYDDILAKSHCK
ncbi:hypothetical protein KRR38_27675 [Novosphingobium sp. G106]|uniref:tetratricopeptide repeat protein n=1 Tax=Novosphingobium sp. G106 TaxID=2849500 RepID=UPI001C2D73B2|nr:hypothetical protein [Novosphingobium sp. G106]MBV1691362.1 hypothetical protein [Novosphingobium sp. G106]